MDTIQSWLAQIHDAVTNHNYWLLAAVALMGVVAATRKIAPKIHGKLGMFLASDHGAILLVFAYAIAGGVATALGGGSKMTWAVALLSVKLAVGTAATYPVVRKFVLSLTGIDLSSINLDSKNETPSDTPTASARTKQTGFVTTNLLILLCFAGIAFVFAVALAGCAPTSAYVNALKVKGTASDTLVSAYRAWRVYDGVHQDDIIATAKTREEGLKGLAAWHESTQRKVDDAFEIAVKATEAYSKALAAAGAAKKSDWGAAVTDVLAAMGELLSALKDAGVNVPAPTSQLRRTLVQFDPDKSGENISPSDRAWIRVALAVDNLLDKLCADPLIADASVCKEAA